MRKWMIALLTLAACLLAFAAAESLVDKAYTDTPTAMTQDSVLQLTASGECLIQTLQPDAENMALLRDVYRFVWVDKNRPARYYDVPTQEKIAALAGGIDIDVLMMTEAMRLQLTGEPEEPVTATMLLDVDYRVGQLVIVVMGVRQEDGQYVWYPYKGRVEKAGEIRWDIPAEDWPLLAAQPVSFHVLTDRVGPRGGRLWGREEITERMPPSFSKDSGDVTRVIYWYIEWGEPIVDDFRVWLTELTDPMQAEVERIGNHLREGGAILDYFPQDRREEALLLLDVDTDASTLIPYDVIALRAENYKDAYGDVNAHIIFGTAYQPEKNMLILAGFPIRDAEEAPFMEWYVLQAEALETVDPSLDYLVELGLKQLNLPRMEEEPMMLVIISEPVVQPD